MGNIAPIWFILQVQTSQFVVIDSIVTSDAVPSKYPHKVSRQAGKNVATVRFIPQVDILQWQIEAGGSGVNTGTILATGGNVAANTPTAVNIDAASLPTEGNNTIFIYVQDTNGTWH